MNESVIFFDYDCGICTKRTANKLFPVIYKPTRETLLICETCLTFIKEHGEFSSYEVMKK